MNTWGTRLRVEIFGESHGQCVGAVLDGLPPGVKLGMEEIKAELLRRAPGRNAYSTSRLETDEPEILSGLLDGVTTGAPMLVTFKNSDTRSGDYNLAAARPGHADYPARVKYNGYADMRGGGHFSGRLTAPLVFAGAVAKQLLPGIAISSRIIEIAGEHNEEAWLREIEKAKTDGDSVGGIVEIYAKGVPAGYGEPFFGSVESVAASLFFSVPAVKAVEFGDGFCLSRMRGSEANDALEVRNGRITPVTNHAGGIQGGITNGAEIVARVGIKPTPTIAREQNTVNMDTLENVTLSSRGRHDPCIVPRACVVLEAVLALAIYEVMDSNGNLQNERAEK